MNHHDTALYAGNKRFPTIAIIGAGFSGAMVAANLLRSSGRPLQVVLIEPRSLVGRGLAYSTEDPSHLLNVPCGKMGAWSDDTGGFHRWAQAMLGDVPQEGFLPRFEYGRYIESELHAACSAAPGCTKLHRIAGEVVAARRSDGGFRIELADHEPITADLIVLALGSGPARIPDALKPIQSYEGRVISRIFDESQFSAIRKSDRVLTIGTGLTMCDAALALARGGFSGRMIAISRRGMLPREHKAYTAPEWLGDWVRSLSDSLTLTALTRDIRDAIDRAESESNDWRSVIDGLRPRLPWLWQRLTVHDRARFISHLASLWDVHRHRCAPEIATSIAILRDRGILDVHAGRVERAREHDGQITASIRYRGEAALHEQRFDRVLVCAGPECDVTRWDAPLMRQLLADGILIPDETRLGVRCSPCGAAIGSDGKPENCIAIVGPLRRAQLWESTAVPELRVQASEVASHVLRVVHGRSAGAPEIRGHRKTKCKEIFR